MWFLSTCRVIHALQACNNISDGGASSISFALKSNTCLTRLDLVSADDAGCEGGLGTVFLWFECCDVRFCFRAVL